MIHVQSGVSASVTDNGTSSHYVVLGWLLGDPWLLQRVDWNILFGAL